MSVRSSLNGVPADEPLINAASAAALYGKGVFTTVAIRDGGLFLWEKHWKRLRSNASALSIDIAAYDEGRTLDAVGDLVALQGLAAGRARVTFFDDSDGPVWRKGAERRSSLLIMVAEDRPRPVGLKLTTSSHFLNSASPVAGVKSCNYLEPLMAYEEARGRGFGEAVRLNEKGHIASACMANVFWEKDGKLFTPSLSTGCLPGTTREYVTENFECEEAESGVEVLGSADRIFLSSAGLGVAAVAEFNGRPLDMSAHPLLSLVPN